MIDQTFFYFRGTARPDSITVDSPRTELQKARAATCCNLGVLHRKILSGRARLVADPEIATDPWQRIHTQPKGADMRTMARFNFLIAGPLPVSIGSNRVAERDRDMRDELLKMQLPAFESGWLAVVPQPEEECKIYTAPRVSKHRPRAPEIAASSYNVTERRSAVEV